MPEEAESRRCCYETNRLLINSIIILLIRLMTSLGYHSAHERVTPEEACPFRSRHLFSSCTYKRSGLKPSINGSIIHLVLSFTFIHNTLSDTFVSSLSARTKRRHRKEEELAELLSTGQKRETGLNSPESMSRQELLQRRCSAPSRELDKA